MTAIAALPKPLLGHTEADVITYRTFFQQVTDFEKLGFEDSIRELENLTRTYGAGTFFKAYAAERSAQRYKNGWNDMLESAQKNLDLSKISRLYVDVCKQKKVLHLNTVASEMCPKLIDTYKQTLESIIMLKRDLDAAYTLIKDEDPDLCPIWLKAKFLKSCYAE